MFLRRWTLALALPQVLAGSCPATNYEVYPGSAFYMDQMLDRSLWSFVATNANGLYHHPVGFGELSDQEEEIYTSHFTSRFAMVEGDMGNGSTTGDVANLQRMWALGLTPVAAFVNRPSTNLAVWRQLVRNNAAQGAPTYEMLAPHRLDDLPLGWFDPSRDYARANMLVTGCIGSGVDAPVYLFANEGAAYRQTIYDLRDWSVANGRRFNYLVSPNNSYNEALLEDTMFLVRDLEDKGHEPDVYGVVLYGARPVDLTPEKTTIAGVDHPATTITGVAYYLLKHRDGEPGTLDLHARRNGTDHGLNVASPVLAQPAQTITLPPGAASTWTLRFANTSPWLDYAGVLRARPTGATADWNFTFTSGSQNISAAVLSARGRKCLGPERWMPGTTREITLTATPLVANPGNIKLVVEALPHGMIDHALDTLCFQHGASVNTPPTLALEVRPVVTRENLPLHPIWFTCGDAETPSPSLAISATSSNPSLVPVSSIVFGQNGIQRWMRISPAAGQWGSATIAVTTGDGIASTTQSFTLTVDRTTVLPVVKANNTNNLETGSSWTGGITPGANDLAVWDATVTGANATVVDSPIGFSGLRITNPGGPVTIQANANLGLGLSGLDLSASTRDLFLGGTISLDEAATWNIATGRLVRATSGIGGPGGITKSGNGTLDLLGNDGFSGPFIASAGTTVKTGSGAQSSTTVSGNAILRVSHSGGFGAGGLNITASNTSTARVEISGGISVLAGRMVTINSRTSNTDAIISTGDNTLAGNINISTGGSLCAIASQSGHLIVSGTLGSIATGNRTYTLRGAGDGTVTGAITNGSGVVGLAKSGSGRWTLAGNPAFTGQVSIQQGALAINAPLPSQQVAVSANAHLLGNAGLGGQVTVAGNHSPGDGFGSQEITGPLSYTAGSALVWQIGGHGAPVDLLTAGALEFAPDSRVDIAANAPGSSVDYTSAYWDAPRQWTVVQAASRNGIPVIGVVSADAFGHPAAPFGQWSITASGNHVVANWTPSDPFFGWLYSYFGNDWNTPGIAGAGVDADGDGWSNGEEWVTGSSPADPGSSFVATASGKGVAFTRLAGRSYEVLTATTPAGPWNHHAFAPAGTGPIVIAPPSSPGSNRFYKIAIRLVP